MAKSAVYFFLTVVSFLSFSSGAHAQTGKQIRLDVASNIAEEIAHSNFLTYAGFEFDGRKRYVADGIVCLGASTTENSYECFLLKKEFEGEVAYLLFSKLQGQRSSIVNGQRMVFVQADKREIQCFEEQGRFGFGQVYTCSIN